MPLSIFIKAALLDSSIESALGIREKLLVKWEIFRFSLHTQSRIIFSAPNVHELKSSRSGSGRFTRLRGCVSLTMTLTDVKGTCSGRPGF